MLRGSMVISQKRIRDHLTPCSTPTHIHFINISITYKLKKNVFLSLVSNWDWLGGDGANDLSPAENGGCISPAVRQLMSFLLSHCGQLKDVAATF